MIVHWIKKGVNTVRLARQLTEKKTINCFYKMEEKKEFGGIREVCVA